jgi:hypothetical protein
MSGNICPVTECFIIQGLIFIIRNLYKWNIANQHTSVLTVALSDLLVWKKLRISATFLRERNICLREIHNRNTLLGDSKQKLAHTLIRLTQNVRKMEFVISYITGKRTNEMDLKHTFRFYQVKIKLFLCTAWSHTGAAEVQLHSVLITTMWIVSITHWSFYPTECTPVPIEWHWEGTRTSMGALGLAELSCPCWDLNPRPPSP